MDEAHVGAVTRTLRQAAEGGALGDLLPLVYQQLRELAARRMANERTGHTLQPTALVHEAYVRLLGQRKRWNNSGEFYLAAAEAMRRILIDHARANGSQKRGGRQHRLPLNSLLELAGSDRFEEILSLDELILRLEKVSASAAQVVRLRFFAGLSTQEAADALGVSVRTLQREWNFARAWLARELDDG